MFINLTGHEVHEMTSNIVIPATNDVFRANCTTKLVATIDGIPVYTTELSKPNMPLPSPIEGVTYIVSALAMNAVPEGRTDVVCPKQVVRDDNGAIIGCKGFRRR